jgi:hypothetical protein
MTPSPVGRSDSRRIRRLAAAVVALVFVALAVGGCGLVSSTPPPATPTDFPGLDGRLNVAGIQASNWVSGDAGCADPDLVSSAISFDARGLDQTSNVRLYFYIFRNRAAFERHRAQVGPCAATYVTDAQTYQELQQSPYVLAGQGPWAPKFEAALRKTLEEAAGTGG